MIARCPVHARHNHACPICVRVRRDKDHANFAKWAASPPGSFKDIPPFFLQSTYPQYRKRIIVDGEEVETHLDGTETAETVIVKYDHSEEYKKWRDYVMSQAVEK